MPGKKSERTMRMQKDFFELRQKGVTISEIAKKYQLSTYPVYQSLREIAAQNGVKREELLYTPHPNYQRKNPIVKNDKKNDMVDCDELVIEINILNEEADRLINKICATVKE